MNKVFRGFLAVFLMLVLVGFVPARGAGAEAAPESGVASELPQEEAVDGQEIIEDEEVPLAEPNVNTVVFMWCGIAMVVVLASSTGYASFGKEVARR